MNEWPLSGLDPGEFPWLLAMSTIAVYLCVPETDQMPAIGLMVVGLGGIELVTRTPSVPAVQLSAALVVLVAGLYGATGRHSAIVGTLFSFWPLVLVATAALWLRWRQHTVTPRLQRWGIGLIGGIAAVAVARTGALRPTLAPAFVAAAVAAGVSLVVCAFVLRRVDGRPARR